MMILNSADLLVSSKGIENRLFADLSVGDTELKKRANIYKNTKKHNLIVREIQKNNSRRAERDSNPRYSISNELSNQT